MDRRDFVSMLSSIPFINKFKMESFSEKEIEKIKPIDETTLLVIRKAQGMTEAFLSGFKNVKFELLGNFESESKKIPLKIKNYDINNGVALIQLEGVKAKENFSFGTIVSTFDNGFIQLYDCVLTKLGKDDVLTINLNWSIAC